MSTPKSNVFVLETKESITEGKSLKQSKTSVAAMQGKSPIPPDTRVPTIDTHSLISQDVVGMATDKAISSQNIIISAYIYSLIIQKLYLRN